MEMITHVLLVSRGPRWTECIHSAGLVRGASRMVYRLVRPGPRPRDPDGPTRQGTSAILHTHTRGRGSFLDIPRLTPRGDPEPSGLLLTQPCRSLSRESSNRLGQCGNETLQSHGSWGASLRIPPHVRPAPGSGEATPTESGQPSRGPGPRCAGRPRPGQISPPCEPPAINRDKTRPHCPGLRGGRRDRDRQRLAPFVQPDRSQSQGAACSLGTVYRVQRRK